MRAARGADPIERPGDAIGRYATALLDIPLPWTRMRHVYALLGLVKRWVRAVSKPPARAPSTMK